MEHVRPLRSRKGQSDGSGQLQNLEFSRPCTGSLRLLSRGRGTLSPCRGRGILRAVGPFMAGDWIKMRLELFTHPRFLSLCSILIYGEHHGLLVYACGADALGLGSLPPSPLTVNERALRIVTTAALRDVTLCCLARVWCAVNAHCKVRERDAIMEPMTLDDIDDLVGFDHFGEALERVGWVVNTEHNSLLFPNFLEFNEPACLRRPVKSNAQRQKEYRERKRGVTARYESNAREEKRRVEKSKKEEEPPNPPNGVHFALTAQGLAQAWCFYLTRKRHGAPRDSPLDMAGEFAELLRLGHTPEALQAALLDGKRDRGEHFWQFKERLVKAKPETFAERMAKARKELDSCKAPTGTTLGPNATPPSSTSAPKPT